MSYRPARLHWLAESIPGLLNSLKIPSLFWSFLSMDEPIAASYMSPNAGGGVVAGSVQLYSRAQINFGDLAPYLIYDLNRSHAAGEGEA